MDSEQPAPRRARFYRDRAILGLLVSGKTPQGPVLRRGRECTARAQVRGSADELGALQHALAKGAPSVVHLLVFPASANRPSQRHLPR
jgi:hypothetical protein